MLHPSAYLLPPDEQQHNNGANTESQDFVHACPARQPQEACKPTNCVPSFIIQLSTPNCH
eukprot:84433-Pelagomonas_calceolata.AAC.2